VRCPSRTSAQHRHLGRPGERLEHLPDAVAGVDVLPPAGARADIERDSLVGGPQRVDVPLVELDEQAVGRFPSARLQGEEGGGDRGGAARSGSSTSSTLAMADDVVRGGSVRG
jgi:hypothetical protein